MSGAVTASVIGGTIAAGAGLGGAAIQSSAAGKAANAQSAAAQQAAEYQKEATQQALQYQQQQYGQSQQNLSPYMGAGLGALGNLSYLLGIGPQGYSGAQTTMNTPYQPTQTASIGNTSTLTNPVAPNMNGMVSSNAQLTTPGANSFNPNGSGPIASPVGGSGMVSAPISSGSNAIAQPVTGAPSPAGGYGSLLTPYGQTFQSPDLNETTDPGYLARLQLGTDALQRSAAARGNVLTGGTAQALDQYAQDYASNEYQNVYNRALQNYNTNYNVWNNDQNNQFSRLMGLLGSGQSAATNLSALGQSGANSIAGTIMQGANAVNQQNNNAAAATASGYASQGNVWGNALSGAGNNFGNLYALQNLSNSGYGNNLSTLPTSVGSYKTAGY